MQKPFVIKKIAVLGAGVMGAQIAAHCVNAGIETLLFDLTSTKSDKNSIAKEAILHLAKLKPSPLGTPSSASLLTACHYDDDLARLSDCDLIIEAIAERLDWKEALYQRIVPFLNKDAVLVSNTSGLSVNTLANVLPEACRERFCGMHFFNPPRYMTLVELIPTRQTLPVLLDALESWITRYLGKGVVRAKDTPNFIANRMGLFSLLAIWHHASAMGLGFDKVDALTGPLLGRPKSATFRTMDVVGLDTLQHVVLTMRQQLTEDPWQALFTLPDFFQEWVKKGVLGQKSGQGFYRKKGSAIEVYDVQLGDYRLADTHIPAELLSILKEPSLNVRMQKLMMSTLLEAQFLVACYRDLFHYGAYHLQDIADTARDVDLALRWGFGWQQGPFELWQTAGMSEMTALLVRDIEEKRALSSAALPEWLFGLDAFYHENTAFSPTRKAFDARRPLPVYERQLFKDRVLGETQLTPRIVFENDGVCLSALPDDVAMLTFKTKASVINAAVVDGFHHALDWAEQQAQGLILYQHDANCFSLGADLHTVSAWIKTARWDALEQLVHDFQRLVMRLKYSTVPTIAALRGKALGGGCELMLHTSSVVAAFESYPGLVEAGVGLLPAGGGCKEMAKRAAQGVPYAEIMGCIRPYFEQIATAAVAGSAPDALARGYLQKADKWVMHPHEVLFVALAEVKMQQAANYKKPIATCFPVAGREGHAVLETGLVNWREGRFISEHDYAIANALARVLCGGDVNKGTLVDETWMLRLEKEAFMTLLSTPLTQARIHHFVETGKPLRN